MIDLTKYVMLPYQIFGRLALIAQDEEAPESAEDLVERYPASCIAQAIRDLECRRLRAERLLFSHGTIRALPEERFEHALDSLQIPEVRIV